MITALVRQPASSLNDCKVTHIDRVPINLGSAFEQFERYCQVLEHLGVHIERLPSLEAFPDSVFIEDNAIVLNELAVLSSMGSFSRQGEPSLLRPVLSPYRRIVDISLPATIEGGDVFCIGKTLFVGLSSRTNQGGAESLRAITEPLGYTVVFVPIAACLHLKTACTPLDDETLLINPSWIDSEVLKPFRLIPIAPEEPFGANVLRVPQGILAHASCPRTVDLMRNKGYIVKAVDISEFSKAEAGVTCLSLLIS